MTMAGTCSSLVMKMDDEASAKTAKNIAANTALVGGSLLAAGFSTVFIRLIGSASAQADHQLCGTKPTPRRSILSLIDTLPVIARAAWIEKPSFPLLAKRGARC